MSDVLVLCYHAVSPTWSAPLSVTPDALERQLSTLVRRGWRGATFTQAVLDPHWKKTLAVTFDDAYASVCELARPILSKLGLPASVFVPTAFMTRRKRLSWVGIDHWLETPDADELIGMDWDDLGELVQLGWEIGSHTRTHPNLLMLDDATLRAELSESLEECRSHVGSPCRSIAYPYGSVDQRVADVAGEVGYEAGGCLDSSLAPAGALRTPRVGIYHGDTRWRFELKQLRMMRMLRASRFWPGTAAAGPGARPGP